MRIFWRVAIWCLIGVELFFIAWRSGFHRESAFLGSNRPSDIQPQHRNTRSPPHFHEAQPSSSPQELANFNDSDRARVPIPFSILYHPELYSQGVWCDPQGQLAPPDLPRLLDLTDEESQRAATILSTGDSRIQDHYSRHTTIVTTPDGEQYFRIDPMDGDEVEAFRTSISKDIRDIGLSPRIADLLATKYIDGKKKNLINLLGHL